MYKYEYVKGMGSQVFDEKNRIVNPTHFTPIIDEIELTVVYFSSLLSDLSFLK